ncbi:hypothetical protein [Ktedonosporobacter rubrisoli]|nr:hypothetical protein [Ktedonosporobacter rubrisoli]
MIQASIAIEQCAQEHQLGELQNVSAEFSSFSKSVLRTIVLGMASVMWI